MKLIKKLAWLGAGLLALVVLALGGLFLLTNARMAKGYHVEAADIVTSDDSATLALGEHVAKIRGCTDCHGGNLAGRVFIDAMPVFARIVAANLTSGANGAASRYTDDRDWVRAIRHGVDPLGRPLVVMPSQEYRAIGPKDLGALVSYIKSVPPVDTEPAKQDLGPMARVLFLTGQLPLLAAEVIDHEDQRFSQPEVGATVEYGAYLASSCTGCHGPEFVGGPIPGTPPEWPAAANITPDPETGIGSWTEEQFRAVFSTGIRPDGRQIDAQYMPWPVGNEMTDTELSAIWLFLRSLPPVKREG